MAGIFGPSSPADDFTVDSYGVRGPRGPDPLARLAPWAQGSRYVAGPPASFVVVDGSSYACLVSHTAGDFGADVAAGFWGTVASAARAVPLQSYPVAITATGQSVIALPTTPTLLSSARLTVNGAVYAAPWFTASGLVGTWAGLFSLAPDDDVLLSYF